MPDCADFACILLAAGEGRRFGSAKLEADLGGKMLGLHAAEMLAAMGFGQMIAVCNVANERLNRSLSTLGFDLASSPGPTNGQANSLALGIGEIAKPAISGALIALADMPFITAQHLGLLASAFDGSRPVCSGNGTARMPPAIFPSKMFPDLRQLSGDEGARRHLIDAVLIEGEPAVLADIDHPRDLLS